MEAGRGAAQCSVLTSESQAVYLLFTISEVCSSDFKRNPNPSAFGSFLVFKQLQSVIGIRNALGMPVCAMALKTC